MLFSTLCYILRVISNVIDKKILFIGFIAFHINFFTPVCFTLPARAVHARTQVTVYLLNLDIIYFHCQIQPVLFLWTLISALSYNFIAVSIDVFISVSSSVPHLCI